MKDNTQGAASPIKMLLPISQMTTEPDTFQFREFETVEDHVRSLAEAINTGNELDPMTVWKRGHGDYVVVDGHHRHAAYVRCGYDRPVPVAVHECSEANAILLALKENTKTKLPMTKTERDNAAWRLVCSDHGLSKAQTVKATGVSDGTVAKMRRTRKAMEENDLDIPESWWLAMRVAKGMERQEWSDDMQEQVILARTKALYPCKTWRQDTSRVLLGLHAMMQDTMELGPRGKKDTSTWQPTDTQGFQPPIKT